MADTSLEKKIVDEIREKLDAREERMSSFYASVGEWDDMFRVTRPRRKQNTFSNPRLTEFHRATIALGTLLYRMQTSKDPFFSVIPMESVGDDPLSSLLNYERAEGVQNAMKAQIRASRYRQNLLKANMFCVPFGTVVVQEDYGMVGVSRRGRRIPVTHFQPRVMDQVVYAEGTTDIEGADWIATMDVVSNGTLHQFLRETDQLGLPYNRPRLEEAIALKEESNTINEFVLNRLRRASLDASDAFGRQKELVYYYGKLDALNDGMEYVAALINRKILVRFHANTFQHGKRNFRIAKWIDWAGDRGLGLGDILGPSHRAMDANRQKAQDNITFSVYSPWKVRKGTLNETEAKITPFMFLDVDDPSDITPLQMDMNGAQASLQLEEIMKSEFRAASGASDTLQAIITDATASEVSLAQNESLRRISVAAEMIAEPLVRDHLDAMHSNNGEYIDKPFNINRAGVIQTMYPADFQFDAEFDLRLTTDKDYKPARLEKLIQALQIITSTKSQHPELSAVPVSAIANEIMYMLDVPVSKWGAPPNPMAAVPLGAQGMAGMAQGMAGAGMGGAQPAGFDVVNTPVGEVSVSPLGAG